MYNESMYTLSINNILAAHTALGIVCAVLLFAFCFSIVHLARLVKFGWKYQKKQSKPEQKPQEPPKQEKPKPQEPTPVYYIVERKRKTKPGYSDPKQIHFK